MRKFFRKRTTTADAGDAEFQVSMHRPDVARTHDVNPPRLPNMTVIEFLQRVDSAGFTYKMACSQLTKTEDQSDAQIDGATKRRNDAEARLREIAREFINA
jgi:hypothetical protein